MSGSACGLCGCEVTTSVCASDARMEGTWDEDSDAIVNDDGADDKLKGEVEDRTWGSNVIYCLKMLRVIYVSKLYS